MRYFKKICIVFLLTLLLAVPSGLKAQCTGNYDPPAGYYDTADTSSAAALRSTLHDIIKDHTIYPYTDSSTDTWDILEYADEDPGNTSNIIDIYKNASYAKSDHTSWNREHTWPSSYGFPNQDDVPYTDCFQLHACDSTYNGYRGNLPFDDAPLGTERPTDYNNGFGGGSGVYPGHSNWQGDDDWQVWDHMKGDVARSLFYLDVRYEGGTHTPSGKSEPDLILTNNAALIQIGDSYMGLLDTLLEWHQDDPVDDCERRRNERVYSYQGNRNPFIDHPEWVCIIWGAETPCQGVGTPTPTPTAGGATGDPWINEIHYDNSGADENEGVEIAGPAGMSLNGWSLSAYNGSNGEEYDTITLSGTLPDQQSCLGTKWFDFTGLQNGDPDGIALVNPSGDVIQFLSYEGTFTASNGPANGMTSVDIGQSESSSTAATESLQLGGTGSRYEDFSWQSADTSTHDSINNNQTFSGGCAGPTATPQPPTATPTPQPPTATPTHTATPAPTFTPGPGPTLCPGNLLLNPEFESWTVNGDSGPPDDWSNVTGNFTSTRETTEVFAGVSAVKLTWTSTTTQKFTQNVSVSPGEIYDIRLRYKDSDPNGKIRLYCYWRDASGTVINSAIYTDYSTDQTDWQLYEILDQTAPSGAATFEYTVRMYDETGWSGSAFVYIDNAEFCPQNVSPTATPQPPTPTPTSPPPTPSPTTTPVPPTSTPTPVPPTFTSTPAPTATPTSIPAVLPTMNPAGLLISLVCLSFILLAGRLRKK